MRSASFFFISLAVHVLVLACPFSLAKPKPPEFIPVTILQTETESPAGDGQAAGSPAPAVPAKSSRRISSTIAQPVRSNKVDESSPQTESFSRPEFFQTPTAAPVFVPTEPAENETAETLGSFLSDQGIAKGHGPGGVGGLGNGAGTGGTGGGTGNGQGNGNGAKLTQVRYRETPKPIYPESARQQGREGTVLLRVLVDDQGRAKTIEINQSSGDNALDRAAGDAIKRWRFSPARYGGKAVESWIRIPIDFHLDDTHTR